MVERLNERIKALETRNAELYAELGYNSAKIEVYKEVIEEMTAETTTEPEFTINGEGIITNIDENNATV